MTSERVLLMTQVTEVWSDGRVEVMSASVPQSGEVAAAMILTQLGHWQTNHGWTGSIDELCALLKAQAQRRLADPEDFTVPGGDA